MTLRGEHPLMSLSYACPSCRTTMNVHKMECRHEGTSIHMIEEAYIDIIHPLTVKPHSKFDIIECANEIGDHNWSQIHQEVLNRLKNEQRIEVIGTITQEGGEWPVYRLLTPEEYREQREVPSDEDLRVIYEEGPVPGCRDNALYAMIAYYENVGMSWERTQELVMDWLDDHGWSSGWDGETAEEHIRNKRHVYDEGYNPGTQAREAAETIRNRT